MLHHSFPVKKFPLFIRYIGVLFPVNYFSITLSVLKNIARYTGDFIIKKYVRSRARGSTSNASSTPPHSKASRPRPLLLCDDVWGPGTKFVTISIILKAKGEPENFGSRIRENNLYPSRSQIQVKKYNVPSGRRHIFIYVCSRFFFQISVGEIHNFQLVVSSAMAATKTEAVPSALRNAGK